MAVIFLVLLCSVGVLAQQPPPLAMTFRQDSSDRPYRTPSDIERQVAVDAIQDDSALARKGDSDLGTSQMILNSEVRSTDDSGCDFPFVKIGSSCYFFSSEQKSFMDAEAYCENLSHGHIYEVTLAMMEYDSSEDQALLDAVTERGTTFWLGGSTEDSVNWSWLDGRPIYLQALFWYYGEPNTPASKCVAAQISSSGNNVRSYIYDQECSDPLNFICQSRFPLNFEFRKIGKEYYLLSEEVGLPDAHWQEARDYCRGVFVPEGYHSDLAVLTMIYDDYDLMYNFAPADATGNYYAWIGAVTEADDCTYKYIDGRPLPISSVYWRYGDPSCGTDKYVALGYYGGYDKSYLIGSPASSSKPFICQMFYQ